MSKGIWDYISRGYSFTQEYLGMPEAIKWTTYYNDGEVVREIGSGTTLNFKNRDEIIASWNQHARDKIISAILDVNSVDVPGKTIFIK